MGGKGSASRESVSEERSERVSKELAESGVEGVSDPKMVFCLSAKSAKASAAVICSLLVGS
jgi:hypothetical protein